MTHRHHRLFFALAIAIVLGFSCLFLFLSCRLVFTGENFLSWRSTREFAQLYFDGIISQDLKAAVALSAGDESGCEEYLRYDAIKDIAQFGGSETRNISIQTFCPGGSDDRIESAAITFEYRTHDSSDWKRGTIGLLTTVNRSGYRYLCEGTMYHGL